jgi:hypothetical protein
MERYSYTKEQRTQIEQLRVPMGIYQMVDGKVIPVALSAGFCELFGYPSLAEAYRNMNHEMYRDVHPDDAGRISNIAVQFAENSGKYEVVFRVRPQGADWYTVIHAVGEHFRTDDGTRLAQIWYMDEGTYQEQVEKDDLTNSMSNSLHEESILKASRYDYLTGLPSMMHFLPLPRESEMRTWRRVWCRSSCIWI